MGNENKLEMRGRKNHSAHPRITACWPWDKSLDGTSWKNPSSVLQTSVAAGQEKNDIHGPQEFWFPQKGGGTSEKAVWQGCCPGISAMRKRGRGREQSKLTALRTHWGARFNWLDPGGLGISRREGKRQVPHPRAQNGPLMLPENKNKLGSILAEIRTR